MTVPYGQLEQPMTAAALIAKLQTYPPDAIVLYQAYSDYQPLESDQVSVIGPEGWTTKTYRGPVTNRLICRKGHYMLCEDEWIEPDDVQPPLTAVIFPGN